MFFCVHSQLRKVCSLPFSFPFDMNGSCQLVLIQIVLIVCIYRSTSTSGPIIIIIIMYIYHALINALSAHMIHINLNMIFYHSRD